MYIFTLHIHVYFFFLDEIAVENHIYHSQGSAQVNQHDQQKSTHKHKLSQPGRGGEIKKLILSSKTQNICKKLVASLLKPVERIFF